MSEDTTICPNCQRLIRWYQTPNGLHICPKCNYSPTAKATIFAGTTINQPILTPPSAPQ